MSKAVSKEEEVFYEVVTAESVQLEHAVSTERDVLL